MTKKKVVSKEVENKTKEPETADSKRDNRREDQKSTTGKKNMKEDKKGKAAEDIATDIPEQQEETVKEDKKEASPEEKLAEMQDRYLRLSAEFDNYRKRTLKEKMDLTKTAGENLLVNILPVMDDFDRAMKVMDNATDCKAMKEGIDLIYNKFVDFLRLNGVKEIESENCDFDTDLHEAVTKIAAPDENMKGKVVDTLQKGYYLNEKVIRFSKVVIGE